MPSGAEPDGADPSSGIGVDVDVADGGAELEIFTTGIGLIEGAGTEARAGCVPSNSGKVSTGLPRQSFHAKVPSGARSGRLSNL